MQGKAILLPYTPPPAPQPMSLSIEEEPAVFLDLGIVGLTETETVYLAAAATAVIGGVLLGIAAIELGDNDMPILPSTQPPIQITGLNND